MTASNPMGAIALPRASTAFAAPSGRVERSVDEAIGLAHQSPVQIVDLMGLELESKGTGRIHSGQTILAAHGEQHLKRLKAGRQQLCSRRVVDPHWAIGGEKAGVVGMQKQEPHLHESLLKKHEHLGHLAERPGTARLDGTHSPRLKLPL